VVPEITDGAVTSVLVVARDITDLKRAQSELVYRAEREHTLRLMTQRMRETLDLEAILSTAVTEIQRTFQADRTLIFRLNSDHSGVVIQEAVRPAYPVTLAMRWEDECFPPDCYAAYAQGQARIVSDVGLDSWGDCLVEFMQETGVQSKMVAPILQRQSDGSMRVWGLLITHACATPRRWQPDELDLLQQVAEQLAIALYQAELHQQLQAANQELERISNTDALTQIANRRYFDRSLAQEWQRAQREQMPLALILCDIDFFKQYNDTYGHPAGDVCITAVAQVLQGCLHRSGDCLARYGGEEFAVILPHTDQMGAETMARKMQRAIAALNLPHAAHPTAQRITLSFGLAMALPQTGLSPQNLLSRADQALYQAKQTGRNRVCLAPALGELTA
jgi:diguanylate cyclase (GGDEF)-like protein